MSRLCWESDRKCRNFLKMLQSLILIGEIKESEEMKPKWFKIEEMPYDKMWLDDIYWHPVWLKGQQFKAYFLYEGHTKIVEYNIENVELSEPKQKTYFDSGVEEILQCAKYHLSLSNDMHFALQ